MMPEKADSRTKMDTTLFHALFSIHSHKAQQVKAALIVTNALTKKYKIYKTNPA